MRILVTGATGNVGKLVVERLVRAGAAVRALSRKPERGSLDGAEMFQGDLAEPDTLRPALEGVERVYLFPFARTAPDVVRLAEQAGVRRTVTLSSGAVATGHDVGFHLPVERAVEASGMEWTHVRPGEFMLNKLWLWGPSIRADRVVREPFPDFCGRPVHERDIADVATVALLEDGHLGNAYTLNGPELISRRDQVGAIAEATGREIRLDVVTPAEARRSYLAQGGFAAASADFLTGFRTYSGEETGTARTLEPGPATPAPMTTCEDVTGRPARTFAEWARDHVMDF